MVHNTVETMCLDFNIGAKEVLAHNYGGNCMKPAGSLAQGRNKRVVLPDMTEQDIS